MLGSIASGKWVLHCMYLRDSQQEGKFLDVSINCYYVYNLYFILKLNILLLSNYILIGRKI